MISTQSFIHEEVQGFKFGYAPFGKPSLFVHTYFIDGLLIDTGQRKLHKQIIASTKDLPVEKIFITHHHEDHTGNIPSLQKLHQCPVYSSEKTSELMKNPPRLSFIQKVMYSQREAYHDLIPIKDKVSTNNFEFEIIPIPGHASDMVALYEPNRKWLFSADLYINSYIGYFLSNESISDQIESTQRILKLDFDTLFCAHNPQLQNGKIQLEKKLRFMENFFDDVAKLHTKGFSENEIFKTLNLKENHLVKILSNENLSKMNMVRSVIRDIKRKNKHAINS
ncbi:MBL fold metallo-hydrolase [Sediminitomix flava]|uniref:Glyoxylase-like metal-dependent hydrolase (Beta-lactamase superfamily II) n=1 Tax=Sediminitomix flava TaxID=379075 RepID=A0A315ZJD7_SEDFL|nr:MBL fold metallo-hydrolase [Sediminitomix flava]PWJ44948.1 glyoxylase-like metal-dependent hydrolase (beta-lactamase superfamily II) [Sediminitomix flava]